MSNVLIEQANQALRAGSWRLRFPDALEDHFTETETLRRVRYALKMAWISLFIFDLFLVVDWLLLPDVFEFAALLRLGVFTPVSMLVIVACQRHMKFLIGLFGAWSADWLIVGSGWCAALILTTILFKSHSEQTHLYHAGSVVVLLYGNLVQQIRFRVAVVFSIGILLIHVASVLASPDFPAPLLPAMLFMLVFAAGSTLLFNYLIEQRNRLRYLLSVKDEQLLSELKAAHTELIALSQTDELTGLANRRAMDDYLRKVWESTRVDAQAVSLLMIDVDHFDTYNDQYGHRSGDQCLRLISQAISRGIRPEDMIVRFGGKRFAAVLPGVESIEAMVAADRLLEAVRGLKVINADSPTDSFVTVTIGVATSQPAHDRSAPSDLIHQAEAALSRGEMDGRNVVSS